MSNVTLTQLAGSGEAALLDYASRQGIRAPMDDMGFIAVKLLFDLHAYFELMAGPDLAHFSDKADARFKEWQGEDPRRYAPLRDRDGGEVPWQEAHTRHIQGSKQRTGEEG